MVLGGWAFVTCKGSRLTAAVSVSAAETTTILIGLMATSIEPGQYEVATAITPQDGVSRANSRGDCERTRGRVRMPGLAIAKIDGLPVGRRCATSVPLACHYTPSTGGQPGQHGENEKA